MFENDVTIFKRPGGHFVAKRKGMDKDHPQGKGPSQSEALFDLLEREAPVWAAQKGASSTL